jgi:hypothetical protein
VEVACYDGKVVYKASAYKSRLELHLKCEAATSDRLLTNMTGVFRRILDPAEKCHAQDLTKQGLKIFLKATMRLDTKAMRYLTVEDWKVLTAVS